MGWTSTNIIEVKSSKRKKDLLNSIKDDEYVRIVKIYHNKIDVVIQDATNSDLGYSDKNFSYNLSFSIKMFDTFENTPGENFGFRFKEIKDYIIKDLDSITLDRISWRRN